MDKRLIDTVADYKNEELLRLRVFKIKPKSNNRIEIGLVAQELSIIEPLLVSSSQNGLLTIDYNKFSVALFSILQEQSRKIEQLQNDLNEMKKKKK